MSEPMNEWDFDKICRAPSKGGRKWRGDGAKCADCETDTLEIDEFYGVTNEVWAAAWTKQPPPPTLAPLGFELAYVGPLFLCVGCLEQRLGRALNRADFVDCLGNDPNRYKFSERLLNRLRRPPANGKSTQ
jgi:hypothetical protein